jgi:hypothetical protein
MIVTSNTVSSINFVTGTWKTELGMLCASIWVLWQFSYEPVAEKPELTENNIVVGWCMVSFHSFNLAIKVYQEFKKNCYSYIVHILLLVDCFAFIIVLLKVA